MYVLSGSVGRGDKTEAVSTDEAAKHRAAVGAGEGRARRGRGG